MAAHLITNKSNIAYLSNFTGSSGFLLIAENHAGKKIYLFTDFRYIERAKNSIKKGIKIIETGKENFQKIMKKHRVKALGIEESDLTLAKFKHFKKMSPRKMKFYDISNKIEQQREIKSKKEIAMMVKSQRINEKVFLSIKKIILAAVKNSSDKLREIDIAWKIKELGYKYGAEDVSFDPIVAFGKHSAIPHHNPDKTILKRGAIVLIDMGMKYKGYCSDMTRMIFTAPPTPRQKEIYNIVLAAQLAGIRGIKAGITGKRADMLSRKIIEKAGYGEKYGHAGGHGIGLDIHEIPSLAERYPQKIKTGSIVTVEPGIYLSGKFGVRIEDMILVEKNGNKVITRIAKKL